MTPTMRTTIVLMACILSRRNHARSATRSFVAAFSPPVIITRRDTPSVRTGSSSTLRRHYPVGSAQPTSPHGRIVGGTHRSILRSTSTTDSSNAACDGDAAGIILDRRRDDDDDDGDDDDDDGGVDPYSDRAMDDLANFYADHGIGTAEDARIAHGRLLRLTEQVLSWNQRLNLVSRKDCTASVVYHMHVLPSVALLPLILEGTTARTIDEGDYGGGTGGEHIASSTATATTATTTTALEVVDVGTGGGFPGLPLAMLLPSARFTLVDSVKKKLVAVSEMATELDVTNVRVHCGRVEEMVGREHRGRYDVVLGRSVTALPKFCSWVTDLVRRGGGSASASDDGGQQRRGGGSSGDEGGGGGGRLIYIIGGETDDFVTSRIARDVPIDRLLRRQPSTSDKRALVFGHREVYEIARLSGVGGGGGGVSPPPPPPRGGGEKAGGRGATRNVGGGGGRGANKPAKGAWSKRQNDVKKQRGYDDFQRFES